MNLRTIVALVSRLISIFIVISFHSISLHFSILLNSTAFCATSRPANFTWIDKRLWNEFNRNAHTCNDLNKHLKISLRASVSINTVPYVIDWSCPHSHLQLCDPTSCFHTNISTCFRSRKTFLASRRFRKKSKRFASNRSSIIKNAILQYSLSSSPINTLNEETFENEKSFWISSCNTEISSFRVLNLKNQNWMKLKFLAFISFHSDFFCILFYFPFFSSFSIRENEIADVKWNWKSATIRKTSKNFQFSIIYESAVDAKRKKEWKDRNFFFLHFLRSSCSPSNQATNKSNNNNNFPPNMVSSEFQIKSDKLFSSWNRLIIGDIWK